MGLMIGSGPFLAGTAYRIWVGSFGQVHSSFLMASNCSYCETTLISAFSTHPWQRWSLHRQSPCWPCTSRLAACPWCRRHRSPGRASVPGISAGLACAVSCLRPGPLSSRVTAHSGCSSSSSSDRSACLLVIHLSGSSRAAGLPGSWTLGSDQYSCLIKLAKADFDFDWLIASNYPKYFLVFLNFF